MRQGGGSRLLWPQRLRLGSGLVLFAFVTTHLTNHALGLISVEAMETGRAWFLLLWRGPVGTLVLYAALGTHLALALWSLYRRRHLRMPAWEAIQLLLGLSIPPLLALHILGTRGAHEWFGTIDSYTRVVLALWVRSPASGLRQALVLVLVWAHAWMGLHFWLRLRPWYPRVAPLLWAGLLVLPVLSLLGFFHAGQHVSVLARDPEWTRRTLLATNAPSPPQLAWLKRVHVGVLWGGGAALGLLLIGRAGRNALAGRRTVRISYFGGRRVRVPAGFSILEASRAAGIPHASVCGGRGRCSTCRVRILRGRERLPPPRAEELRVLSGAGLDPGVRLACQLRPTAPVTVAPLLPSDAPPPVALAQPGPGTGQELEIAVLFVDLRAFTGLVEHRLPYDVVFLLSRYAEAIGQAVQQAGGRVNQFTGDGAMALFGLVTGAADGCRQALAAAVKLSYNVAELGRGLGDELEEPLRVGIGIHVGPAVVGTMGYGEAEYLTAVGDTVHVASRLQELTKHYGCQLVLSEMVAERAGVDLSAFPKVEAQLRGRETPLLIHVIEAADRLELDGVPRSSPAPDAGPPRRRSR